MKKEELIKGIETTISGLEAIKNSLLGTCETQEEFTKATINKVAKEDKPVDEKSSENANVNTKFSREELKAMKYNEFKKLASDLGVKCTGTREELVERVMALNTKEDNEVSATEEEQKEEKEVKEVKKEKTTKSVKPTAGKKISKAKAVEPSRDEFDEQAERIAEETPLEDIISTLAEVNVKATKRNAVVMLAKALREELIELGDEDEEDTTEESNDKVESKEAENEVEITPESYFPEFDPQGYNDPEVMTEERHEAIIALVEGILEQIESSQIGEEDIESYLEDNCTDDEKELLPEDYTETHLIGFYLEMIKRTVDDEGEKHEPADPYELCGKDVCCGHELKYVKKTGQYVCEICGTEYQAE